MGFLKKTISLSIIASLMVFSTGCNGINPVPKETSSDIFSLEKQIKYVNENQKDYEEIKISKHVYKRDNLNQENIPNIVMEVNFNKRMFLKDISSKIGFPVLVEKSIEMNEIYYEGNFKGDLKTILNFISGITGVYWTYERGVIKFVKQKDIIYNFPAFSIAKMNNIYNVGETEGSPFKIDDVKSDVFDEIQKTISNVLDNVVFSGDIKEIYSYQKDDISEETKNNILRNNFNNSNKNNSNFNLTEKKDNKNENSVFVQKDKETNDNKNYDYLLGKDNPKGAIKQPTQQNSSGLGLSPSINNRTNLVDSAKESKNNLDKEIESLINMKSNSENKEDININTEDSTKESLNKNIGKDILNESKVYSYNTRIQGNTSRVSISKESGIIYVTVNPSEEQKIDNILEEITKNMLGALINLDLFILEVEEEKLAEFNQNFNAILTSGVLSKSFSLNKSAGASISYDNATNANAIINGGINGVPVSSKNLNFVLNYLTGDSKGSILSQPKILTLPNTPARIKDAVFIPYLKPGEITSNTTNITYQVENVNSGIDLGITSSVLGKDLIISLGLRINEYLGDKTISAGTLGEYNLPMQAPKVLNNTFRVTPGDIIILGGSNKTIDNKDHFENFFLPTSSKDSLSKKKFIIVAMPKLIKFIEE